MGLMEQDRKINKHLEIGQIVTYGNYAGKDISFDNGYSLESVKFVVLSIEEVIYIEQTIINILIYHEESKNRKERSFHEGKTFGQKKELEKKGSGGGMIYPKEGTIRFRIKDPGEDCELAIEIIQFYLGPKLGGVISPATFNEDCPFMEKYLELKESKDEDDKLLAKKLVPKEICNRSSCI